MNITEGNGMFSPNERRRRLFWAAVRRTDFCWFWRGAVNKCGYGLFGASRSGTALAHRWAWELTRGPIPKGMSLCHTCDNPRCVNPNHLYVGTHAQNMRDKAIRGRHNAPIGERNRAARMTAADIVCIRTSVLPAPILADRYGVSRQAIHAILDRRTWKHVT